MEDLELTTEEIIIEEDSKAENYFSGSAFKDFYSSISKYPLLSKEENKRLALLAQQGDKKAREKVVNSNLRLVVSIAYKYEYKIQHMQVLDIIQEGCLGLMKSVDKFDPERGSFITCAHIWIEQAITRAIENTEKEIRLPVHVNEKRTQYIKLLNEYERSNKPIPTDEEICKKLKISEELLYNLKNTSMASESINRKIKEEDSDTELENFIIVEDDSYDRIIEEMEDRYICIIAKEVLSPKLYYVFYYRCLTEQPKTLEKIAKTLGITKEGVRQLEEKALSKIKPYVDKKDPRNKKYLEKIANKNINYGTYNIEPLEPNKIILYHYIKKDLSKNERKVLYSKIFDKYPSTYLSVGLSKEEYILSEETLKQKIQLIKSKPEKYAEYKENFIKFSADSIFSLIDLDNIEIVNYKNLCDKYSNLSFEEISNLINSANIELSLKELNLLERYFSKSSVSYKSNLQVSKELYLLEFCYKKKKKNIPINKLWDTYKKHILDFTDEQQLYLECFLFNKYPKKVFKEKYPDRFTNHISGKVVARLERYYYKIEDLNENSFNKKKYLIVKKRYKEKLTKERIQLLDLFYGVSEKPIPITEIANILNEDYITVHGKVRHARNYCISLYNNMSNTLNIDLKNYKKYILNKNCEFTDETRNILKMFVIDCLDYDKIDELTNLGKYRISNIITEGIRKIDFYRFGIIEIDESTIKEVEDVCNYFKKHFDKLEIEIIKRRKVNKKNPDELAINLNITKDTINRIIAKYNRFYFQYKIKDIELTEEEILEEINRHSTESVINDECKEILSVFYGFKTKFNPSGRILSVNEIKQEYNFTKSELYRRYYVAIDNIKAKKVNILKNELIYIDRDKLNDLLNDVHLPISDKERDLICCLLELKGYPLKTIGELAEIYGNSKGSIKRRYQRAIVNIYKYLNNEIEGILNYEIDIEPNLKYFSSYDVQFIKDFYRDNLTYEEIVKKYNYTFDVVVALMRRIKNNIYDLVHDKYATKFDFEYYRNNKSNEKLPFNGDIELTITWFELFNGEGKERKYTIPEIYDMYEKKYSLTKIQKNIVDLMLSFCKLKDGIEKDLLTEFTEKDVLNYYESHLDMALSEKNLYERYLNNTDINKKINLPIIGDLLMERYPDLFDFNRFTRDDIFKLIKKYYSLMSPSIKEYLMYKYDICERDFMSGKDINHTYKIFYNLDKKLCLTDDISRKRKLD